MATYGLEEVSISLQPDYVRSGSVEDYESIDFTEISAEGMLLTMSIGLRVGIRVLLFTNESSSLPREAAVRAEIFRSTLSCAKAVFCRMIRDRVVDMMSSEGRAGVISFFFDPLGKIESASGKARPFCEELFPVAKRIDDYFPLAHWEYLQGAMKRKDRLEGLDLSSESLVFCLPFEDGILNCLLQKMGANGYLLSITRDR